ncbi:MAG TPA: ABC transporter ATP-binding protein [Acidimicrobiia bacterium]
MTTTVEINALSKWFGNKVAVSEVTLQFSPGVTGLLGPNGAGKTTLMRVMAGLQMPSQGSVSILGEDPRANSAIYSRIAMVPEDEAVYGHLTATEFVALAARLSNLDDVSGRVKASLDAVEMSEAADRKMEGFSKGMRQRTKVAAALVSDPEVLLLDEPLNGADPVQRARLIGLFRRLGDEGKTVIVSSHVLAEVERMTDQVIAMVDGRLAAVGHISEIRAAMSDKPRQIHIEADEGRRLSARLIGMEEVRGVQLDGSRVTLQVTDAARFAILLPDVIAAGEFGVTRVEPTDESLESVFRYLVEGS